MYDAGAVRALHILSIVAGRSGQTQTEAKGKETMTPLEEAEKLLGYGAHAWIHAPQREQRARIADRLAAVGKVLDEERETLRVTLDDLRVTKACLFNVEAARDRETTQAQLVQQERDELAAKMDALNLSLGVALNKLAELTNLGAAAVSALLALRELAARPITMTTTGGKLPVVDASSVANLADTVLARADSRQFESS